MSSQGQGSTISVIGMMKNGVSEDERYFFKQKLLKPQASHVPSMPIKQQKLVNAMQGWFYQILNQIFNLE
jgi:hypothetical protein